MLLESKKNLSGQGNSKLVVLTNGHRAFRQYAEHAEGSDSVPSETPLFRRVSRCVRFFEQSRVYIPTFVSGSKCEAFVPEVLKAVWTMCWKRWYDCVSCAFHGFFEDEKESRIKGWRRNRRSAQSLLPAVRAVDGGFSAVGCGVF